MLGTTSDLKQISHREQLGRQLAGRAAGSPTVCRPTAVPRPCGPLFQPVNGVFTHPVFTPLALALLWLGSVAGATAQSNGGFTEDKGGTQLVRSRRAPVIGTASASITTAPAAPAPAVPVLELTGIEPTEAGWRIAFTARVGWEYRVEQAGEIAGPWLAASAPLPCLRVPLNDTILAITGSTVQHRPMSVEVLDPAGRLPARTFWRVVQVGTNSVLPLLDPFTGITSTTNLFTP